MGKEFFKKKIRDFEKFGGLRNWSFNTTEYSTLPIWDTQQVRQKKKKKMTSINYYFDQNQKLSSKPFEIKLVIQIYRLDWYGFLGKIISKSSPKENLSVL